MVNKRLFWLIVVLGLVGFLLFAGKNPFSSGSIIPNLEPYPDTLYYATPAWNFVHGKGFHMVFEGNNVAVITPPLYSIYLIPFFAVFNDVRAFYFANMLLMLSSVVLFFFISRKIFGDDLFGTLLTGFLGFFFVTNFYVYTLPTLLLAENVTFFLLTLSIYFLFLKNSKTSIISVGIIGVLLFLTKFSNLPLTASLYFLFTLKAIKNKKFLPFSLIYFLILTAFIAGFYLLNQTEDVSVAGVIGAFGAQYFQGNLAYYTKTLLGSESNFLWFRERMIVPVLGSLSFLGIISGLIDKKTRMVTFQVSIIVFSLVLFMSFFYVADMRYIFAIYSAMLILVGLAIGNLKNKVSQKTAFLLMIIILGLTLIIPNLGQRKSEIMAKTLARRAIGNVRGNEIAWYYVAVTEFNRYFATKQEGVYLGTFLPPFFVDYYANGNYKYLPISKDQDFFSAKGGLSEKLGIEDITAYYTSLLMSGKTVYVSNAYAGNLQAWGKEFETLKARFELKLVHRGCLDSCNIYKVELK